MGTADDVHGHASVPAHMLKVCQGQVYVHPLTLRFLRRPDVDFEQCVPQGRVDGTYPVRDFVRPRRYLFLMRHAQHDSGRLTPEARTRIEGVAGRLREWRDAEWRDRPQPIIEVRMATKAPEVRATSLLFARRAGLGSPGSLPSGVADGQSIERALTAYSPDTGAFDMLGNWLDGQPPGKPSGGTKNPAGPWVLLVGNDPLVSWLADRLCSGRPRPRLRRPPDVAIDKGELVCLVRRGNRWELVWTMSGDGAAETDAVLAKVKSKGTVATALGTVIVGMTTFLLQNAVKQNPTGFQWLAIGALGASAIFYFATLFLYDGLQMPARFWASKFPTAHRVSFRGCPTLARPPTSTARVLQVAMVQIWSRVFIPATLLAGIGIVLLAFSVTAEGRKFDPTVQWWHIGAATAVVTVLSTLWVMLIRPDLGTTD